MHSKYAGFLHDEINRYIRLQCDNEPLSRDILKISELVRVINNSTYTNSSSADKLARVAKNDTKPYVVAHSGWHSRASEFFERAAS